MFQKVIYSMENGKLASKQAGCIDPGTVEKILKYLLSVIRKRTIRKRFSRLMRVICFTRTLVNKPIQRQVVFWLTRMEACETLTL